MNKIIFLDIDGVVCTLRSHFAFGDGLLMQAWDITACQMIRQLCIKKEAKLVITSVWRFDKKEIDLYLSIYCLADYLHEDWRTKKFDGPRGNEVAEWLIRHPEVNKFAIIDDDSDFTVEQKPFLIQTNSEEGFSARDFIKVTEVL